MWAKRSDFILTLVIPLAMVGLALALTAPQPGCASGPIYVDADATGANDGTSWGDAYTDLQTALANAVSGDEIWVAEGVYYPDDGVGQTDDDRASTFDIVSGVALYGGFPTGGGTFDARDWETYVTVLSGDLDQNDTVDGDGIVTHTANISGTNAYHVVTTFEVTDTTTLDGFVVTAGHTDDTGFPDAYGGGMLNYGDLSGTPLSTPQVNHVIFSGNYAGEAGGGMLNFALEGATLTDVTFIANRSDDEGGGLAFYWSGTGSYRDSLLEGLTFERNVAAGNGGGMLLGGSPAISNTTFVQNSAAAGGGIFAWSFAGTMNLALTNTTFLSNTASTFGGGLSSQPGTDGNITLTDVTFAGNQANGSGGGGMNHSDGPATLTRVTFENNVSNYRGGGFRLENDGSATMNEVSFIDNTARIGGGIYTEDSTLLLTHGVFAHNQATEWGGGIFFWNDELDPESTLKNVLFSQNTADDGGACTLSSVTVTLRNATIANNTATHQGGGFFLYNGSVVKLANSILWGNAADNDGDQIYYVDENSYIDPSDATVSYSDVQGCGGSASWDAACGTDGGNNIDADPRFVDAANDDLRLRRESPAIDAGNNLRVTTSTDLAGHPRRIDAPSTPDTGNGGAPVVDMGAYEATGPIPALQKSVTPSGVVPYSSTITYTLLLENVGVLSETTALVTDTLPSGVTFDDWVVQSAGAIHQGNAITWTETITAGERITLAFTAVQTGDYGETVTNTAHFSSTAGVGHASAVFSINQHPVADAGEDQPVTIGNTVQLDGSGSNDPDGHSLTYQWTQTGGSPQMTMSENDVVSPTFTATDTGTFTFTLVVSDTFGLSDTDEVVITVEDYDFYLPLVVQNSS
jgi:uncharacterized repeat protein (TIGR01451 family)